MTTLAPVVPSALRPLTFAPEMDAFLLWMATHAAELEAIGSAFALSIAANSTTSLTVGTGTKSLTVEAAKGFLPGMEVFVASAASPSNRMIGTVTSYNSSTGALVVSVSSAGGSGTFTAWSVGPASTASWDSQTYTDLRLAGKITETVYPLTGTVIDPANGSIQTKTLTASTTLTESLATGNSVVLVLTAGAYSVTWPTTVWLWGAAPTMSTTGVTVVLLFKVGSTLIGVYAGGAI